MRIIESLSEEKAPAVDSSKIVARVRNDLENEDYSPLLEKRRKRISSPSPNRGRAHTRGTEETASQETRQGRNRARRWSLDRALLNIKPVTGTTSFFSDSNLVKNSPPPAQRGRAIPCASVAPHTIKPAVLSFQESLRSRPARSSSADSVFRRTNRARYRVAGCRASRLCLERLPSIAAYQVALDAVARLSNRRLLLCGRL